MEIHKNWVISRCGAKSWKYSVRAEGGSWCQEAQGDRLLPYRRKQFLNLHFNSQRIWNPGPLQLRTANGSLGNCNSTDRGIDLLFQKKIERVFDAGCPLPFPTQNIHFFRATSNSCWLVIPQTHLLQIHKLERTHVQRRCSKIFVSERHILYISYLVYCDSDWGLYGGQLPRNRRQKWSKEILFPKSYVHRGGHSHYAYHSQIDKWSWDWVEIWSY